MVDKEPFNDALEALASFRETHLQFAVRYIAAHERDPRGTGGTPYMSWLSQLIDETRAAQDCVRGVEITTVVRRRTSRAKQGAATAVFHPRFSGGRSSYTPRTARSEVSWPC